MRVELIETDSYRTGINEIKGLKDAMRELISPIEAIIKDKAYWTRESDIVNESEYLRRDGFIPHSHNLGGLEISIVVPKCESYKFDFLDFGDCDECGKAEDYPEGDHQCGYKGMECGAESDGHLDAKLRIWFKFEGYDEATGDLSFYLYLGGGNGDAPYFRTKYETDIFEAEFTCKSVSGLKRVASKHIKSLIKILEE